jgi:hypothetical protein
MSFPASISVTDLILKLTEMSGLASADLIDLTGMFFMEIVDSR